MKNLITLGLVAGMIAGATTLMAPTGAEAKHDSTNRVRRSWNPGNINQGTNIQRYNYNRPNAYNYTNVPYNYGAYGSGAVSSDPHSWYTWANPSTPSAAAPWTGYGNAYGGAYGNVYGNPYGNAYGNPYGNVYGNINTDPYYGNYGGNYPYGYSTNSLGSLLNRLF